VNSIVRSRVIGIAVVLLLPLVLMGCTNCDTCMLMFFELCPCPPGGEQWYACMLFIGFVLCRDTICEDSPEEFCEKYPEVCQEFADECLEAPDTEAEE